MTSIFDNLDASVLKQIESIAKSTPIAPKSITLSPTTKAISIDLERPLIIFDIEATGVNPYSDRIVEIGALKQYPDGKIESICVRFNPECQMDANVIAVHGITNEDVANEQTFGEKSLETYNFFKECDLGGFGLLKFDVPILREEFLRVGINWDLRQVKIIDALRIYHTREPRNLTAALKFYCQESLDNAHTAFADAEATFKVIAGQLNHYADLTKDLNELSELCNPKNPDKVDEDGKLKWKDNEVIINFGNKAGLTLRQLAANEPNFLKWILNKDFSPQVKDIVKAALKGEFLTR